MYDADNSLPALLLRHKPSERHLEQRSIAGKQPSGRFQAAMKQIPPDAPARQMMESALNRRKSQCR